MYGTSSIFNTSIYFSAFYAQCTVDVVFVEDKFNKAVDSTSILPK